MKPDLPLVGPLERTLYLQSLPIFDDLRSADVAIIAQLMREEYVPQGTVLYEQGELPSKLHVVVSGTVRNEHNARPIYVHDAPAAAGIHGLLGGPGAGFRGVAETDLTVLAIDSSAFLDVLEDHFDILLHFRRHYALRVVGLQRELGAFLVSRPGPRSKLPSWDCPLGTVERLLCLRRTRLFAEMPINALAQIIRGGDVLRRDAGETLWRTGDPGDVLVVLTSGEVLGAPGDPKAAFRAGPGYLIGADAALGGIPYAYDAVTASPIVGMRIYAAILTDVVEDHFEVGFRTLAHFVQEEARLLIRKAVLAGSSRAIGDRADREQPPSSIGGVGQGPEA